MLTDIYIFSWMVILNHGGTLGAGARMCHGGAVVTQSPTTGVIGLNPTTML